MRRNCEGLPAKNFTISSLTLKGLCVMRRFVVGITGASGVVYGTRLVEALLASGHEVHLVVSEPAVVVATHELGWDFQAGVVETCRREIAGGNTGTLRVYENHEIWAPPASGSFPVGGMVVIPCSMSTLSGIAHGSSNNLIERAADVMLKEKRLLVLVPRETPLNVIHLRNMLSLAEMGVSIVPAMPGFYHQPRTVDDMVSFVVGKVMDILAMENRLFKRYEGGP